MHHHAPGGCQPPEFPFLREGYPGDRVQSTLPASARISVVLPAPEGPKMMSRCPSLILNDKSSYSCEPQSQPKSASPDCFASSDLALPIGSVGITSADPPTAAGEHGRVLTCLHLWKVMEVHM